MKKQKHLKSSLLKSILEVLLQNIQAEKIICFGRSIKNTTNKSCFSPETAAEELQQQNRYYLLIVPAAEETLSDALIQQRAEECTKSLAQVVVLVHRMKEINVALQNGSTFFKAVYAKGIPLHDNKKEPFVVPAPDKEPGKLLIQKEKLWNQLFELSLNFLMGASFYASREKNNLAVFMLHQTLQHCYCGMLRVLTGYRTNSSGLSRLLKLVENVLPEFSTTSGQQGPQNTRLTGLLTRGFGDARFNLSFKVDHEEVILLIERIEQILKSANKACRNRLQNI